MFPGSGDPQTMSQSMDTIYGSLNLKMYMSVDGGTVYEAAAMDLPSSALNGDTTALLEGIDQGITAVGGKINGSRNLTFKSYPAREIKFTEMSMDGYARYWVVGQRFYMLMVLAKPGTTMYPQHFFETFNMN